jgi:S1-C subfamily serine protease
VANVEPGGAADAAGIRQGDRIVQIGGDQIAGLADLQDVLAQLAPGQRRTVSFVRTGQRHQVQVQLGDLRG